MSHQQNCPNEQDMSSAYFTYLCGSSMAAGKETAGCSLGPRGEWENMAACVSEQEVRFYNKCFQVNPSGH